MLSKRGERYESNPFVADASLNTTEGMRRRNLKSKDGTQLMITSQAGEVVAPVGFWQTQEVDQTQFVKLYINGVKAFADLTSAGAKVFELLYVEVQKNIGKDQIWLTFPSIDQRLTKVSKAVFYRGMKELLDKKFIAESLTPGLYYLNPDYMWNGNRLAFVKEYRVRRDEADDEKYRQNLEARGQLRLENIDPETGEIYD